MIFSSCTSRMARQSAASSPTPRRGRTMSTGAAQALKAGGGRARVLVVNTGNSNAFTGAAGIAKNRATVASAEKMSGCGDHEVFVSATGVIGEPMPPHIVSGGVEKVWEKLGAPDFEKIANCIRTTGHVRQGGGRDR